MLTASDAAFNEQINLVQTDAVFSVLYSKLSLQLWSPGRGNPLHPQHSLRTH